MQSSLLSGVDCVPIAGEVDGSAERPGGLPRGARQVRYARCFLNQATQRFHPSAAAAALYDGR
jgi:hypothetical protein